MNPSQLNLLCLLRGQIFHPKQPKAKCAERNFITREESHSSINTSKVIKKHLKILIMFLGIQSKFKSCRNMSPQGLSDGLQRVLLIPRLREKGDNYL